jgi:predicted lipoprotein with Yx(FWY)xxD motif
MIKLKLLIPLATVAVLVAGCGSSYSSSSKTTSKVPPTAKTASVDLSTTKAGKVLVGPGGRTLYLFEKDTGSSSNCSGACANHWPPLTTTGKPSAGSGVQASMLGTTMRSDGKEQVTYNGHPLYYFAGDKSSGSTAGQGVDAFGAEWYVVGAGGSKVEKSGGGSDSSGGSSSGGSSSGGSMPNPY